MIITTFLMFEGKAGEAIDFYVGLFGGAIKRIVQSGRSTFYCPVCQR